MLSASSTPIMPGSAMANMVALQQLANGGGLPAMMMGPQALLMHGPNGPFAMPPGMNMGQPGTLAALAAQQAVAAARAAGASNHPSPAQLQLLSIQTAAHQRIQAQLAQQAVHAHAQLMQHMQEAANQHHAQQMQQAQDAADAQQADAAARKAAHPVPAQEGEAPESESNAQISEQPNGVTLPHLPVPNSAPVVAS